MGKRLVVCGLLLCAAFVPQVFAHGLDYVKSAGKAAQEGDYALAAQQYTAAIDSDELPASKLYLVYTKRANLYSRLGRCEDAFKDYDKAVALRPDFADAYYNRGNLHSRLGQYDKAIADYTKAIEFRIDDADAHNNRGMAWHEKGNYESAMANYNRAIAVNPNDPVYYANRGRLWDCLGKDDLARVDYLQAKELDPGMKTPID